MPDLRAYWLKVTERIASLPHQNEGRPNRETTTKQARYATMLAVDIRGTVTFALWSNDELNDTRLRF